MRKLKLQVQMTVDGYVAGPKGEMDWLTFNWDDEIKQCVTAITEPVDTIVLGRRLAEGFISHWASVAADPNHPEVAGGRKFTDTAKVVFTKTLDESAWDNTVLAKGDLASEITKLKEQDGGDIIAYGGATFVSGLIKHGLIDEFHLFVNPAVKVNVSGYSYPGTVAVMSGKFMIPLSKAHREAAGLKAGDKVEVMLEHLTKLSEAELANLHGMGPKALGILKEALQAKGLDFKT